MTPAAPGAPGPESIPALPEAFAAGDTLTASHDAQRRALIENAPVALAMFDRDMRYLHTSRRWREDVLCTTSDCIGLSHYDLFPNYPPERKRVHEGVLRGETVRGEEDFIARADGAGRWFRWEVKPWHEAGGAIGGVIAIAEDVTAQRKANDALRESRAKLQAVFRAIAEGVLFVNSRGEIEEMNDASRHISGLSQGDLMNPTQDPRPQMIRPDGTTIPREEWPSLTVLRTGQPVRNMEMGLTLKDGRIIWELINAQPVRADTGELLGAVVSFVDITERKKLEKEIHEIGEREKAKIGFELHENTCQQLAGIEFNLEALKRKLHGNPLEADIESVAGLVRECMMQTRQLAWGLSPFVIDPGGIGRALRKMAATTGRAFRIECTVDCDDTVSLADSFAATHLYRIAQEAVDNAVRHGRATVIHLRLERIDKRVMLTVTDNGVGLPESRTPSPGMGLRLMQFRAALASGTLQIEPNPAGGTIVICSLSGQ